MQSQTKSVFRMLCVLVLMVAGGPSPVLARAAFDLDEAKGFRPQLASTSPAFCVAAHRVGKIELAVNNNGTFGTGFSSGPPIDYFTGEAVASCEYPQGSNVKYLFAGAFWIGAVIGRDTLVSVGADGWYSLREMFPDEAPFGEMVYRSITDPDNETRYEGAISEEDYLCVYSDTFTDGVQPDLGVAHRPLNIEVSEASYAWSYAYAEDLVLFDYRIRNIGARTLEEVYMGIYVDADVCFDCANSHGYADDLCGFLHTYPLDYGSTCNWNDEVFVAWIADNDGDYNALNGAPNVTATRMVRTPSDSLAVSFNWWISNGAASQDFGPRHIANVRDFGHGGLGTPSGDRNKYYVMKNGEFDYDQAFTAAISPNDSIWLHPNEELAGGYADGFDTRYLLSFGPFDIDPGQTLPISFAYLGGENFHRNPTNARDYLPHDPEQYYANLGFSDLANNAVWAAWIYDNPGVDTDSDGFAGRFHLCNVTDSGIAQIDTISSDPLVTDTTWYYAGDTIWYEGDGVPDFRGATPPPAPDFWVHPGVGRLRVRFNGVRSETTPDVFSRLIDFEGYRVYLGRDDRASSFVMQCSYDLEDYNKLVYTGGNTYQLLDNPFTIEQLRCLYGASCDDESFDPLRYTPNRPFPHPDFPDSFFAFTPQDYNVSQLGVNTPIHKVYPDAPFPSSTIPDSADPADLTPEGRLKYFEYEVILDSLLPSVPWWVNVTAFDYGSPQSGLAALETAVQLGAQEAYATHTPADVEARDLEVIVYPNPYRGDADYRGYGFEARVDSDRPADRTRIIYFANLPAQCTIRIYTIDGDLVREIAHRKAPDDPTASHETWNLITRNTQLVVSGIYYWTVEDDKGRVQIGTLAIML